MNFLQYILNTNLSGDASLRRHLSGIDTRALVLVSMTRKQASKQASKQADFRHGVSRMAEGVIDWRRSKPRRVVKVTSELALHAPSRLRPVGHTPSSTQNFAVGEEHGGGRFRFTLDASPRSSSVHPAVAISCAVVAGESADFHLTFN